MENRTKGAVVVGLALVVATLIIVNHNRSVALPINQPALVVAPTLAVGSPKRQPISITDENQDGVPDWQELLNNTTPLAKKETASYTPPETLTGQFAVEFFESYLQNEQFGEFGQPNSVVIERATDSLWQAANDTLYTEADVVSYSGRPADITRYANALAALIDSHQLPAGTSNEGMIVEEAVVNEDEAVLAELAPIVAGYEALLLGLKQLSVPEAMVAEHLDLLNSVQALSNGVSAFATLATDPLNALLRLKRYQEDATGFVYALIAVFEASARLGEGFGLNDPVHKVYQF